MRQSMAVHPARCARCCSFLLATTATLIVSLGLASADVATRAEVALHAPLRNLEIERHVDLRSKVARLSLTQKIGLDRGIDVSEILLTFPRNLLDSVTFPTVASVNGDKKEMLTVRKVPPTPDNLRLFAVVGKNNTAEHHRVDEALPPIAAAFLVGLQKPMKPSDTVTLLVEYQIGHCLFPLPKTIKLTEVQKVIFYLDEHVTSPYPTELLTTSVTLGGAVLRTVPSLPLTEARKLKLSPLENIPPQSSGLQYLIHYTLPRDLGHFTSVERHIEVSHYGTVFFHEIYNYVNEAAELHGEYDRPAISGMIGQIFGSLRQPGPYPQSHIAFDLEASLHRQAYKLEYYDHIGNISSSHARADSRFVSLNIEPRYPVLGGWTADWFVEYTLPTKAALSLDRDSHTHVLNLTFSSPFHNIFIDKLTTRVSLPNGAKNFKLFSPKTLEALWVEDKWGWLDVLQPRKVVAMESRNVFTPVADLLLSRMQIHYDYADNISDLQSPLICVLLALVPLMSYVGLKHFKLRVASKEEAAQEDLRQLRASNATGLFDLAAEVMDWNHSYLGSVQKLMHGSQTSSNLGSELEALQKNHKESIEELSTMIHTYCEEDEAAFGFVAHALQELQSSVASAVEALASRHGEKGPRGSLGEFEQKVTHGERDLISAIRRYSSVEQRRLKEE